MANREISALNAFIMIILIIFWGSSFVVVKIALNEGLTPIAVATFRFLIAGGLFLIFLLFNKARKRDYSLLVEKKDLPKVLFLALTGITFMFTAQYTGIKMSGASIAAIFVCLLSPIFIVVFSVPMFKERLTKKRVLGICIAAVGTFTVITGGSLSFTGSSNFLLGSLILLSTPILWAAYSLIGKKITEKYDSLLVVAYATILGGLCLIPFSLAENSIQQIISMTLNAWFAILFLSVTCSLFGYYAWIYMLKKAGTTLASSFLFLEPVVTAIFAAAIIGETLTLFSLIGGLLIFVGVLLINK